MKFKEGELKMKKLLVLMFVLGLATTAQAALSLSLSATTVDVGSDVVVSVSSDNTDAWTFEFVLSEDTYNWTDPLLSIKRTVPVLCPLKLLRAIWLPIHRILPMPPILI